MFRYNSIVFRIDGNDFAADDFYDEISLNSFRREAEQYGDVRLSIQASRSHYCSPREDGLPLGDYKSVEVGLLRDGNNNGNPFIKPSAIGAPELDHLYGHDDVAGWVSWEDVNLLRDALRRYASRQQ